MKNWRTTVFGFLTGISLIFGKGMADPGKPAIDPSMIPAAICAVVTAWHMKDKQVSGTDKK